MANKTKVILNKHDSALIVKGNGSISFAIPHFEGSNPPSSVVVVISLAMMLSDGDEELHRMIKDKFESLITKYTEKGEEDVK